MRVSKPTERQYSGLMSIRSLASVELEAGDAGALVQGCKRGSRESRQIQREVGAAIQWIDEVFDIIDAKNRKGKAK